MTYRKVYFTHYGYVWAYPIHKAVALCLDAIMHDKSGLNDKYAIKTRVSEKRNAMPTINKRHVNKCLDWKKEDWELLLNDLLTYNTQKGLKK